MDGFLASLSLPRSLWFCHPLGALRDHLCTGLERSNGSPGVAWWLFMQGWRNGDGFCIWGCIKRRAAFPVPSLSDQPGPVFTWCLVSRPELGFSMTKTHGIGTPS